jgi:hypothetical protein
VYVDDNDAEFIDKNDFSTTVNGEKVNFLMCSTPFMVRQAKTDYASLF